MTQIHPTAVVEPGAELDEEVSIGAYSVIGSKVRIGRGSSISSHVHIEGNTTLGSENKVFPFTCLGTSPQDIGYKDEPNRLEIGDRNIIREHCDFNIGTTKGGAVTRVGSQNYIMAYSHIAHDSQIGNEVIFTNAATVAGHTVVEDCAILSAFVAVHQFVRVGAYSMVGAASVVTQDVPPYSRVIGSRPATIMDVNAIGLRRRGFSPQVVQQIKEAYKTLFWSNLNTREALELIEKSMNPCPAEVQRLIDFFRSSRRGVIKKTADKWILGSE